MRKVLAWFGSRWTLRNVLVVTMGCSQHTNGRSSLWWLASAGTLNLSQNGYRHFVLSTRLFFADSSATNL